MMARRSISRFSELTLLTYLSRSALMAADLRASSSVTSLRMTSSIWMADAANVSGMRRPISACFAENASLKAERQC